MNEELLGILEHMEREKGISRDILFKAIESALASAARKIIGKDTTLVVVTVDRNTGEIEVISDGKKIKSDEFGRIAAQTAKQVIIQKIREAEKDIVFEDYSSRIGGIASGAVHRFEKGAIIVDLGKTEGIFPRHEQCPNEKYKQGERLRAYIKSVTKTAHGPEIILSRADPGFVKKLFELEVPEISQGIVEIKGIAREPGERTKLAVHSSDEKIDPVGACVGMRGTRVKDIVRELRGERIDIIRWKEDVKDYLKEAISPAAVEGVTLDKENKKMVVTVKDDQLSIAIGKHGQNVRLASRLIGWEIDVRGKTEKKEAEPVSAQKEEKAGEAELRPAPDQISLLEGVGKKTREQLLRAGLDTLDKIAGLKIEDLVKIEGIGKKRAEKIIAGAKTLLEK